MNKSLKSIREEVRKDIAKQYKERYESRITYLENELKRVNTELYNKRNLYFQIQNENDELKDKLAQYEDWITRLQEWCNLPDDERAEAINQYNIQKSTNMKLNELFHLFKPYIDAMTI